MAQWFKPGLRSLSTGTSWLGAVTATLHSSTLAPSAEWATVSQLTAGSELATGGGYVSGGKLLTSLTSTYTTGSAWSAVRANSTAYAVGDVVRQTSGAGLYRCTAAGTTASSVPTYNATAGFVTSDGTATFEYVGAGIVVLGAATISWPAATFQGVRYLVLSERTSGTASAQPLLGYVDLGSDKAGQGGSFDVTWSAQGVLQIFTP